MNGTGTVIESQLDWLTCAAHTQEGADRFERYASAWAATTERDVERRTPFRLKGYEGWQRGRVRFGEREGAAIIQLSGDLAARHFDTLLPLADSISRLDIAVTTRLPTEAPDVGLVSYRQAADWYQAHTRAARPSFHGDADGGYTCYVGDRSSDWFLRVYNKAAEARNDPEQADHYARCWRYELECKGASAPVLAAHLGAVGPEDRAADVQSMLHDYATRHGIEPTFERANGAKLIAGFRRRSDRASKLAWLARSVRPAVEWLAESGDARDVFEALGLPYPEAGPSDQPVPLPKD